MLVKLQFYLYREMVRGSASLINFDVDFFRAVIGVLFFTIAYDTPVSIRQYTISFHMERRRNEYMVDTTFCKAVRIEIIECSVGRITEIALLV